MTRVADTSALYALLAKGDQNHDRAVDAVCDPEPILVPSTILAETIDLVKYRYGVIPGLQAMEDLMSLPHLAVADDVPFEGVRAEYERVGGRLSVADAIVVQTCRALGAKPLAYDKRLLKAARR